MSKFQFNLGQVNTKRVTKRNPHYYRVLGANGILYEYRIPYGRSTKEYYKTATDVRSVKTSKRYENGYSYQQYQPIGDLRYFTFYQLQFMNEDDIADFLYDQLVRDVNRALRQLMRG